MNSKDKNSFLILGLIIGIIALVAFFTMTTKFISPIAIVIISVVLQCVIIKPIIVKQYYALYNSEATAQRFIPILNEFAIFSKGIIVGEIVTYALMIITILVSMLPVNFLYNFMSDSGVAAYPIRCFLILIIELLALSIIRGIGFFRILNDVREKEFEMLGFTKKFKVTDMISLVALLVPVIRVIGLLYLYNYLNKIVAINGFTSGDGLDVSEFEEV